MKTYKYYRLNDPKKEAVGRIVANSERNALILASQLKVLSINEFSKIYAIQEEKE